MKKIILPLVALTSLLTVTSCGGGSDRDDDVIYVCVYDGGYGSEWIETVAAKYTEKQVSKSNQQSIAMF